jgi:hypothetical protein
MKNNSKRDTRRAATTIETAEVVGVSPRSVRRVLEQKQENETVLNVFMFLEEGKTELLKAAEKLVPFN